MSGVFVELHSVSCDSDKAKDLKEPPSKKAASAMSPETEEGRLEQDQVDDEGCNREGIGHCGGNCQANADV